MLQTGGIMGFRAVKALIRKRYFARKKHLKNFWWIIAKECCGATEGYS